MNMKNTLAGALIALIIIFIGFLASLVLWESSPNEKLKIEGEEKHNHHEMSIPPHHSEHHSHSDHHHSHIDHHHHHNHHHDHDDEHDDWIAFSEEQLASGNIELIQASSGTLTERIQASGKVSLHPDHVTSVMPRVNGIVIAAKKNIGDKVGVHEELASIESREMAEAKAAYLAAFKRQELKQRVFEQEQTLYNKNISSEQDYLQAEADLEEANIDLELAHQKLLAMGVPETDLASIDRSSLCCYSLKAPVNGTVIHRHLNPGELLETTDEAYQIADLSTQWIELDISNSDFGKVKIDNPVTIYTCEGTHTKSTIAFINPLINEDTRKGTAVALISQDALNCPVGTFVYAHIETGCCTPSIVVAKQAMQKFEGSDVLFVKQDGGFAIRPVQIGRTDEKNMEILSGILPGEIYASQNAFIIKAEQGKAEAHHEH